MKMQRMRCGIIVVLLCLCSFAVPSARGALVTFNTDFDSNGAIEVEGSRITTTFNTVNSQGTDTVVALRVDVALMTSEDTANRDVADLFEIKLTNSNSGSSGVKRGVVDEGNYSGLADLKYDFTNSTIDSGSGPQAVSKINGPILVPQGPDQFNYDSTLLDGALQWQTVLVQTSKAVGSANLKLEILLADSADDDVDTVLLVDKVRMYDFNDLVEIPIADFETGNFTGWTREGETGVYHKNDFTPGVPAIDGDYYAALGTVSPPDPEDPNEIPAPVAAVVFGLSSMILATRRRAA